MSMTQLKVTRDAELDTLVCEWSAWVRPYVFYRDAFRMFTVDVVS